MWIQARHQELVDQYQVDDFHSPFVFYEPGFNLRSTDLNAFIGLEAIAQAGLMTSRRQANHDRYPSNWKRVLRSGCCRHQGSERNFLWPIALNNETYRSGALVVRRSGNASSQPAAWAVSVLDESLRKASFPGWQTGSISCGFFCQTTLR